MSAIPATSRRRYRFSDVLPITYVNNWQPQSLSRPSVPPMTLDAIINRDNLVRIFKHVRSHAGQGPGIDGYRYSQFSVSEAGDVARVICQEIKRQAWRPRRSRAKSIPKQPSGTRTLRIRCAMDRLVSAAVSEVITHELEFFLFQNTFAYRPHRCVQGLLAQVARNIERDGLSVVGKDDVRDAFGSIRIEDAVRDYARIVDDAELLHLIEVILRGHDRSEVGIEQGDPLSPPTLNLRSHFCLSLPSPRTTGSNTPLRLSYADDHVYLSHSVSEGQRAVESDGALLAGSNMNFKGRDNYPIDLRRQGASTQILGLRIRLADDQVMFGLSGRAYQKLEAKLQDALSCPDTVTVAKAMVAGWYLGHGPAFESCGGESSFQRVQSLLAAGGLHELASIQFLRQVASQAVSHWRRLRYREEE